MPLDNQSMTFKPLHCSIVLVGIVKAQLNSTQQQFNLSWVGPENCFANPTHPPPHPPQKLNISCELPKFDHTLKVASWEHLEQIPTIQKAFVKPTFALKTFVHIRIRNVSAVTDPILMKL